MWTSSVARKVSFLVLTIPPWSSSSLYIWNQGSSYLIYWQLGAWFQIYRELEDQGLSFMGFLRAWPCVFVRRGMPIIFPIIFHDSPKLPQASLTKCRVPGCSSRVALDMLQEQSLKLTAKALKIDGFQYESLPGLFPGATVDGSEIPRPTTVWMFLKPCKSRDTVLVLAISTGVCLPDFLVAINRMDSFQGGCNYP